MDTKWHCRAWEIRGNVKRKLCCDIKPCLFLPIQLHWASSVFPFSVVIVLKGNNRLPWNISSFYFREVSTPWDHVFCFREEGERERNGKRESFHNLKREEICFLPFLLSVQRRWLNLGKGMWHVTRHAGFLSHGPWEQQTYPVSRRHLGYGHVQCK